jgi:O-antigen/teichoic acid export membrane protein
VGLKIFLKRLFSSQLRINMVSGTATTIANLLVVAISYPLYLNFLGYETYGIWLIMGTVMSFAQLGNLGIGPAVMKLVAEEHGRRNLPGIQCCVTTASVMLCVSGIIILMALLFMNKSIVSAFKLNDRNAHVVLWLLPYIGGLSIYVFVVQIFGSALSGLGRMDLANYIQTFGGIVQLVIAGLLLLAGFGIQSLLFGSIASCLVIHALTLISIRRIEPLHFFRFKNINLQYGRRLISFGSNVFAGSLLNMLISPFNKLFLSRYAGVAMVPVYEIAFTGSMQVRALIESGLRSITPEISRASADMTIYAKNKIALLYRRTVRIVFFFGIPVYAILLVLAPVLLKLWLGARFVEALPAAFRIMLAGTFVSLISVPAYYTLLGLGRVRHILGSHMIQSVTNVLAILAVMFFSPLSIDSIVWCTSFAMAVSAIYLLYYNARAMDEIAATS